MKLSAIYLMIVGILWILGIAFMVLALSAIASPVSLFYAAAYWVALLIGPVLLIVGSTLCLLGKHQKIALGLCILGCIILTVTIAYQSVGFIHMQPLEAPLGASGYALAGFLVLGTLLADSAAWILFRKLSASG
jgi:hypothetical protein